LGAFIFRQFFKALII